MNSDIFKEKEESEIVAKSLDPECGLEIEDESIDLSALYKKKGKTYKLTAYNKTHKMCENPNSEIKEVEENFKHFINESENAEYVSLEKIPEDFEEVLVSLDELMEYLDNSEEEIDV